MDSTLWLVLPYGPTTVFKTHASVRYFLAMVRKGGCMDMPMTPHEFFAPDRRGGVHPSGLTFRGRNVISSSAPFVMTGKAYMG